MSEFDWSKGFRAPNKERFLTALRHEQSGRAAFHESGVAPETISAILEGEFGPTDNNLVLPPEHAIELAWRMGMDVVTLNEGWRFERACTMTKVGGASF